MKCNFYSFLNLALRFTTTHSRVLLSCPSNSRCLLSSRAQASGFNLVFVPLNLFFDARPFPLGKATSGEGALDMPMPSKVQYLSIA